MLKHGMRRSPEYASWGCMRTRCNNPNAKDYARYGAKGITCCAEFDDFAVFLAEVGPRPKGTTLDRINPRKGYEVGNVKWSTPREQSLNRQDLTVVNTPAGPMPLVDYARKIGLSKGAAHLRLKRGKLEGVSHV